MSSAIYFMFRKTIYILTGVFLLSLFHGCKEDDPATPVPETGTMTDIEGNVYRTIKIGNQWWMAENLKVQKFRNGSNIPVVGTTEQDWVTAQSAYCLYGTSTTTPGFLYNWSAVSNTAGLAPEGWRIPTDADWKLLESQMGMDGNSTDRTGWRGSNEGEKLKLKGIDGWELFENVWATNESGFSAEAGSCRLFNGIFGSPGLRYNGFWWTSSEYNQEEAWFRHLDYKQRGVFRYQGSKKYGFSVRCVMNQ